MYRVRMGWKRRFPITKRKLTRIRAINRREDPSTVHPAHEVTF
jgi:hypothetical protein